MGGRPRQLVSAAQMVSFGESVLALGIAAVVGRGSDDMLLISRQIRYLASISPGEEGALDGSCSRVRVGANPQWRGIHALSRSAARQPIASPCRRSYCRTTVAPESATPRARILARSRTGARMGGQASGADASRRTDNPRFRRPRW